MHPAERLRYVARSSGAAQALLVEEAAAGLTAFCDNPGALVTACRRVLARQPTSGPLVWLAAHLLAAPEPRAAARDCVDRIRIDRTSRRLAGELATGSTVAVIGWPEVAAEALVARPDLQVLVVDAHGEASGLVNLLDRREVDATLVPVGGLAAAVAASQTAVIEASAVGPDRAVAVAGSLAAAAVAALHDDTTSILVAGVGRVLPARMFAGVERRLDEDRAPWWADDELVAVSLFDRVAHDGGVDAIDGLARLTDCPVVPELFGSHDGIAL